MKTNIVKITYEEWIKNPFPMPKGGIRLNETTRYKILNCPTEYADELRTIGCEVETPEEKVVITFVLKPKKQYFIRADVISLIKYYCELQRIACQLPLASLEASGKISKQESEDLCKRIRVDADIFNIRNPEEEI